MSDYYFRTEDMTVGYDGKPLIKDIDIDLNKGEILTLIGPNGSGKSTILKSITKHLKMLGGTVYIDKNKLDTLSYKDMSTKVAVVLTERLRPELMTCWELVATGRYPYTDHLGFLTEGDKEIVAESMEMVHAIELKDCDFNSISDGQRQRILLARAICQKPEIIVLDEPTSFLDIKHKLELLNILRYMAKEHKITVIMSIHEIDLAQKISDKVMCVKGDKIYNYGTPKEIFSQSLIQDLYDITNGTYNITFGSVEFSKPEGEPKLFVVSGGGTGIEYFRDLQHREIPFYAGILHKNDIDYQVALALAAKVFSEKAFCRISEERYREAYGAMMHCSCVLYTGVEFGEMNQKNKLLLKTAEEMKIPVVNSVEKIFV